MQTLPWIAALAVLVVGLGALAVWALRPRRPAAPAPLPTEWALTARPVFNVDERRVYRLLREALPHHIVLSKLPLVRFCQPNDPNEVRYWYDLLGSNHVAFAVCSANGRVLAAIDLDNERGNSRRIMQIKQSVLAACRVRYLRCPADHLPTVAELQLLVPQHGTPTRGPQPAPAPAPSLHEARDSLASTVATRRAERTALWQDSTFFQDSFFAPDNRLEGLSSEFGPLAANGRTGPERSGDQSGDDVGGVVVDAPQRSSQTRH
ncbi:DUF2726 domain-containing protein [Piscinibacter sp. XHJ-5]|uniref:DUF2726 domain-containing protein n=1 Tax=Piscinibacter sp. XHJ-5 TaxID=3037797 RepID=UPI0024537241|nr:DUF2726 domain-containing protein [Piscinibacter sp. XHJ-5]